MLVIESYLKKRGSRGRGASPFFHLLSPHTVGMLAGKTRSYVKLLFFCVGTNQSYSELNRDRQNPSCPKRNSAAVGTKAILSDTDCVNGIE
jgi:hypothetical protein